MKYVALDRLATAAVSVISKHSARATCSSSRRGQHELEEILVVDRRARQVDRHQRQAAGPAEAALQQFDGTVHHPAVHHDHDVVAFGRRNELVGRHQRAVLVAQADHQLEERRVAGGRADADDALRVQLEPAVFDGARDAPDPLHFAMAVGAVVAFVDLHAVAAAVLGRVTGDVGRRQHRRGTGGVARDAHDADARAHRQAVGAPQEAVAVNGLANAVGHALGLFQRTTFEQQAEFVAAQARDGVRGTHARLQQAGDVAQQPVAGAVAAGVVDHLELVEVDVQQHVLALAALRGRSPRFRDACRIRAG